jgi:hypothetical protein
VVLVIQVSERLEIHGNEMVQRTFKEASAEIALKAESDHTSLRKGKKRGGREEKKISSSG